MNTHEAKSWDDFHLRSEITTSWILCEDLNRNGGEVRLVDNYNIGVFICDDAATGNYFNQGGSMDDFVPGDRTRPWRTFLPANWCLI